jgi:hypothetical protein
MRKSALLSVLLVLSAACGAGILLPRRPTGDPVLEVRGAIKDGPFKLGAAELDALPRRTVQGTDPVTGRTASWEGVALGKVLTERVELQRGADTVLLRTADRRAVPVPYMVLRQLHPVLADRADGQPLSERIVAWPNAVQRGLDTDPRARSWWARGVVALEVVNGSIYLRSLTVPEGASTGARVGASLYEARCLACHRMRKAGGEKGPELTQIAQRLAPDALGRLLERHPGWSDALPEPPDGDSLQQLWAFLRAVSTEPVLPAEEAPRRSDRLSAP